MELEDDFGRRRKPSRAALFANVNICLFTLDTRTAPFVICECENNKKDSTTPSQNQAFSIAISRNSGNSNKKKGRLWKCVVYKSPSSEFLSNKVDFSRGFVSPRIRSTFSNNFLEFHRAWT